MNKLSVKGSENFKWKNFSSLFKKRSDEFKNEKERFEISKDYLEKKVSLKSVLIDSGSIMFSDSPLKSFELEELLFNFVIFDSEKPESVRIEENKKYGNWKSFLNKIDNPKANDFFTVEEDKLMLNEEGVSYIHEVLSAYRRKEIA